MLLAVKNEFHTFKKRKIMVYVCYTYFVQHPGLYSQSMCLLPEDLK